MLIPYLLSVQYALLALARVAASPNQTGLSTPPVIVGGRHAVTSARLTAGMRIFGPAVAGAAMQLTAIVLVTILLYSLARGRFLPLGWPLYLCDEDSTCQSATLLVRISYLLTAIGVALTTNRLITQTMLWARQNSHEPTFGKPRFSPEAVAFQLSIVAIGSTIEELETPAQFIVTAGQWIGGVWLGAILWPAIWSIVVASVGSLLHALCLSLLRF
jgi:hypothetical protein